MRCVFVFALVLTAGPAGCTSLRGSTLEPARPEEVALTWQECTVSPEFEQKQAEDCFGHPMPL